MSLIKKITKKVKQIVNTSNDIKILRKLASIISSRNSLQFNKNETKTTLFFNASTRLEGLSQNAAFSILTANALESQGIPVMHFVCNKGMSRCVLGTNRDDITQTPPCHQCINQSKKIFSQKQIKWFTFHLNIQMEKELRSLNLNRLNEYEFHGIPLGQFNPSITTLDIKKSIILLMIRLREVFIRNLSYLHGMLQKNS